MCDLLSRRPDLLLLRCWVLLWDLGLSLSSSAQGDPLNSLPEGPGCPVPVGRHAQPPLFASSDVVYFGLPLSSLRWAVPVPCPVFSPLVIHSCGGLHATSSDSPLGPACFLSVLLSSAGQVHILRLVAVPQGQHRAWHREAPVGRYSVSSHWPELSSNSFLDNCLKWTEISQKDPVWSTLPILGLFIRISQKTANCSPHNNLPNRHYIKRICYVAGQFIMNLV